jgi:hypothetical protein
MSAASFPHVSDGTPQPRRRIILFYRQPGVVVTSRYLEVAGHRYHLDDLGAVTVARGAIHPGVLIGLLIAVVEAVIIAVTVVALDSPIAWPLVVVAALIPSAVGLFCAKRWPALYQLNAEYHGEQLTLFTTRDEREFGQVSRALRRALEAADER